MADAAAIVLAGGRSSRMGSPKAALDWHGSALLRRVTGIVARALPGPVVVVRAPGQELPALPASVEVVEDAREGRGPMQGLAAGLAAIGGRAPLAYVSSTDAPLLHPAFVRRVVAACGSDVDVALPEIGGHHQPTAATYRAGLVGVLGELLSEDQLKPAFLYARCRVRRLDEAALLSDPALAAVDPALTSLLNVNDPAEYERALSLGPPQIIVEWRSGAGAQRRTVGAWTLGDLAVTPVPGSAQVQVVLNGEAIAADAELPLAAGDVVSFAGPQPVAT